MILFHGNTMQAQVFFIKKSLQVSVSSSANEIKAYTTIPSKYQDIALKHRKQKVEKLGTDAIINARFMILAIMIHAAENTILWCSTKNIVRYLIILRKRRIEYVSY